MSSIDATSALLSAAKREFAGLLVTVEAIRSVSWSNGLYDGADHDLTLRLDGDGAAAKANAFAGAPDFDVRGHLIAELEIVGQETVTGAIDYARLAMRVKTLVDHAEPRAIPEPDAYPAGAIATFENRRGEPWFLVGYPSGTVVITNGVCRPPALRLYRFGTEAQAKAGAETVVDNSRLGLDGTWFVPDVAEAFRDSPAAAERAMLIWAAMLDIQLGHRLRGLGSGHYTVACKALAPRAIPA